VGVLLCRFSPWRVSSCADLTFAQWGFCSESMLRLRVGKGCPVCHKDQGQVSGSTLVPTSPT